MEEGNQAVRQLPVTPAIEQFMNNDDVVIDDVFLPQPLPPSYDEAVSSSPHRVLNLMSNDEEDDDDDVFVNWNHHHHRRRLQSSNWTSDLFSTYSYIFNVN